MAFIPVQQYKIAVSGTATAGQLITEFDSPIYNAREIQATFYAKGCDVVYKMSDDSGVTADATPTSNKLVAGNTLIPAGSIMLFSSVKKYISVISEDEASTGVLFMTIGYNEQI